MYWQDWLVRSLGLTYSFIKKPVYTATLSFALEDEKSGGGLGGALGLASSLGLDLGGGGGSMFSGANLTELFKIASNSRKDLVKFSTRCRWETDYFSGTIYYK